MTVKTYAKDVKLSEHFRVKEFACVNSNIVKVDTNLIEKLEELRDYLNCSKIIINSGYRTPAHDKAVGGSGKGQHTLGKAADVVCYDKNGSVINAKIVCCAAQDLGFRGIANISTKYRAVHLDVRSNGKYYGDEIKHFNTVTNNFYNYFKIKKPQVCVYTEKSMLVIASTLNVRANAGTQHEIVDKLKCGARVKIKSVKGDWAQIGKDRWVHTTYIK